MRLRLWPQSLFGRLIAATVIGVLLAQTASLYLVARNEQRIVTQVATRVWARRISEITLMLAQLPPRARARALHQLRTMGGFEPFGPPPLLLRRPMAPGRLGVMRPLRGPDWLWLRRMAHNRIAMVLHIPLPLTSDAQALLLKRLRDELGSRYRVAPLPAGAAVAGVIPISLPPIGPPDQPPRTYDLQVSGPGTPRVVFRVARISPAVALPPRLLINLALLVAVLIAALYVAARGITRPLSRLARAADTIGRGARAPPVPEKGARELRNAARAFNSMQERLHRYLDSRTSVLAAMSHDLKTPLTRLRLQVETLIDDPTLRDRLGHELDEMEGMVRGALALFRGLDDQESVEPIDVDALVEAVRRGFAEMGDEVSVSGHAAAPLPGRPQALKRCLTNLVSNAVNFGDRARIEVHDGAVLRIVVSDAGPGIPPHALERVFEPFYRLESSRNRDTGGTGLGLSIARDVAQAHGGTLSLRNRPEGGLEAELRFPRR
ncbi:MAG: ATP-binding protein [Steroidobacteraceae bacterium]